MAAAQVSDDRTVQSAAPQLSASERRLEAWTKALQGTNVLVDLEVKGGEELRQQGAKDSQNLSETPQMKSLASPVLDDKASDPAAEQDLFRKALTLGLYREQTLETLQKLDKLMLLESWGYDKVRGEAPSIGEQQQKIINEAKTWMAEMDPGSLSPEATAAWGEMPIEALHRTYVAEVASRYAGEIEPISDQQRAQDVRELRRTASLLNLVPEKVRGVDLDKTADLTAASLAIVWGLSPSLLSQEHGGTSTAIASKQPKELAQQFIAMADIAEKLASPKPVEEAAAPDKTKPVENSQVAVKEAEKSTATSLDQATLMRDQKEVFELLKKLETTAIDRTPSKKYADKYNAQALHLIEGMGLDLTPEAEALWRGQDPVVTYTRFCALIVAQYASSDKLYDSLTSARNSDRDIRSLEKIQETLGRGNERDLPLKASRALEILQYYNKDLLDPDTRKQFLSASSKELIEVVGDAIARIRER